MTNVTAVPIDRPRRLHLHWLLPALLRPRATFAQIAGQPRPAWLTPLLLLTLTGLLVVAVAGPIRVAAAQSGQVQPPPDFQFWSPEQQEQYFQAQSATAGPVFVYVFPAILAVLQVWVGWLVVGGLLHLVLTMLGGRDSTGAALNLVAWASLPFVARDLLRLAFMLSTRQLIASPGLSGFAPAGEGWLHAAVAEVLAQIDLYALWFAGLLVIGVRSAGDLTTRQVFAGVSIALLAALLLAVLPGVLLRQLSSLTIVRPFFF